jgi:hypothetical protein
MSYFQFNDPKNPVNNTNKIVYNYFSTTINKSEIKHNINNDGEDDFLSMSFINSTSTYNLYYTGKTNQQFSTSNIYLCGLLHNNITGITTPSANNGNIIGELVIEHKTLTGSAFVCFLLKKPDGGIKPPTNDIDNIYYLLKDSGSVSETVILNNIIPTQDNCFVYNDKKNNTIFVFTTPITINEDTAASIETYITTTKLFDVNPTNYVIIPKSGITKFQEDQIYIDCSPTGASQEEINTYNVPINSELMHEKQEMDYMKTSVNFFTFVVGLAVCYFAVPQFYKTVVIDKSILFHSLYPSLVPDSLERIRSADVFIMLFFAIGTFILFWCGYSYANYNLLTVGIFCAVFYGLSFSIIQNNKIMNDFMSAKNSKNETVQLTYGMKPDGTPNVSFDASDMGLFLAASVKFLLPLGKNTSEKLSSFPAVYVGVSICYAIILFLINFTTPFDYVTVLLWGIGIFIPLFVLLVTLINM